MRLTPLDIKKQDFKRVMRGVDPEEVQAFLNMVADQWQDMSEDQGRLEHKITELETKLQHYKEVEEALQEAVKTARESSRQTLDAAKQKAQSIVDAAAETAERLHNKAQEDQYQLRRDIQTLRSQRAEVIARLKNVLRTQLEFLSEFDRQYPVSPEPELDPVVEEIATEVEVIADEIEALDVGEDEQERVALDDMAHLDAASDAKVELESEPADEPEEAYLEDENTLVFTEQARPADEPVGRDETPPSEEAPPSRRESQRDSTEMDKIRKILDDLA